MTEAILEPRYKVELIKKGGKHFYGVGSDIFPGTTGILNIINKPALINWAKREALGVVERKLRERIGVDPDKPYLLTHEALFDIITEAGKRPGKIKDDAADLGTQAHAFIDLIVQGKDPGPCPEAIAAPVEAFRRWWKGSGITFIMGDTKVASRRYGYGGSLDWLGKLADGSWVLGDWKTSKGIWPEYALQVGGAYAQALLETYGIAVKNAVIVRFGKALPIDFEAKWIADIPTALRGFLAAKALSEVLACEPYLQ